MLDEFAYPYYPSNESEFVYRLNDLDDEKLAMLSFAYEVWQDNFPVIERKTLGQLDAERINEMMFLEEGSHKYLVRDVHQSKDLGYPLLVQIMNSGYVFQYYEGQNIENEYGLKIVLKGSGCFWNFVLDENRKIIVVNQIVTLHSLFESVAKSPDLYNLD
jgi:hypothetical protein